MPVQHVFLSCASLRPESAAALKPFGHLITAVNVWPSIDKPGSTPPPLRDVITPQDQVSRAQCEPLPELDAWIDHSTRPDLPAVVAQTHRSSSRETWLKFLGSGLLEASSDGNLMAVKQLLAGGAPVHTRDAEGRTAMHRASEAGHAHVVGFLLHEEEEDDSRPPVGARTDSPAAPQLVWQASTEGPILVPTMSLRKRVTVDARDNLRSCSAHLAAARGHAHVVQLLVLHGADISCVNGLLQTPLHAAAAGGSTESMRVLLGAGGNAMARDGAGRTPLHLAASSGWHSAVSTLVEGGADLEATATINGRTALHEACAALRPETVKQLLNRGANELAVDTDDRTPRAMIGETVADEERMIDPDVSGKEERIRRLLDDAPKDRLWRRRRLMPLLRWQRHPPPACFDSEVDGSSHGSLADVLAGLEEGLMRLIVSYL